MILRGRTHSQARSSKVLNSFLPLLIKVWPEDLITDSKQRKQNACWLKTMKSQNLTLWQSGRAPPWPGPWGQWERPGPASSSFNAQTQALTQSNTWNTSRWVLRVAMVLRNQPPAPPTPPVSSVIIALWQHFLLFGGNFTIIFHSPSSQSFEFLSLTPVSCQGCGRL